MEHSKFSLKKFKQIFIVIVLLLTISCTPHLINIPRDPNIYNTKAGFSDVDLYITTFTVKNKSKKDMLVDNSNILTTKLVEYIKAQNKFREIHVVRANFEPPTDKNYITLDVQITPEYTIKRTWILHIPFFWPCPGYWPITPQRGVVSVDLNAYIRDRNNDIVTEFNITKKRDYKIIFYSWYNTSVVENTFRNCYEEAFDEFSQTVNKNENVILAAVDSDHLYTRKREHTYSLTSKIDIEKNIPETKITNPDAIAVVIGNSNYSKTKNVDFAINDASLINEYLIKTLGYKDGNIFFIKDASKGEFELYFGTKDNYFGKLYNTVKENKSDIFVYYSGHGGPGSKDAKAYFIPVECDPNYVELGGYSLNTFYRNLSKIPAKSTTVVLDACFSGVDIIDSVSPIVIKVENPIISLEKGIVFTSSKNEEYSCWYPEKKHGLFTYFFLKAIHDKNADINNDNKLTVNEIYHFISNYTEGVPYFARRIHGREQHPMIYGQDNERIIVKY